MAGKTVVMVLDTDDSSRGEIKMLADSNEAARLAEDLLESGVAVERIRVFDAIELSMKVAHRPVVSLGADGVEESAGPPELLDEFDSARSFTSAEHDDALDAIDETVNAEPLVRNGVRFSSLFKSDNV